MNKLGTSVNQNGIFDCRSNCNKSQGNECAKQNFIFYTLVKENTNDLNVDL